MRLRQLAVVVRDLEPAVAAFCDVLGLEVAYRDPGVAVFGLRNAVLPIGDTFLEVLSPAQPDTAAGRFLERRGEGGYMLIFQTGDLEAARERASAAGVRVVWETQLDDAATIHLHPRDLGGAIASCDWMDPPEAWRWAGPAWREHVRTGIVDALAGVELSGRDPASLAERWARVLGRAVGGEPGGCHRIALDAGELRFVPAADGRGEGVTALRLRARDAERAFAAARAHGLPVHARGFSLHGIRLELA